MKDNNVQEHANSTVGDEEAGPGVGWDDSKIDFGEGRV